MLQTDSVTDNFTIWILCFLLYLLVITHCVLFALTVIGSQEVAMVEGPFVPFTLLPPLLTAYVAIVEDQLANWHWYNAVNSILDLTQFLQFLKHAFIYVFVCKCIVLSRFTTNGFVQLPL